MRKLLYAATAITALALTPVANATVILNFGQTDSGNTVNATASGGVTNILATNVGVSLTQILDNVVPGGGTANFSLNVSSVGPASVAGTLVSQTYKGGFSIISTTAGSMGKNVLSGTFTDALFGGILGSSLTLSASNGTPGEAVSFTSDFPLITAEFNVPEAISFGFTNVTPGVTLTGLGCFFGTAPCTISSFSAAVTGNFSGTAAVAAPEPASMALLGVGLLGLGFVANRKRSV